MKYVCDVCGWEYDEEQGYPEGCLLYTSGMSEEFIKNELFTPFVQADNSPRSDYNVTGLGMPIVKQLVEKMGGTITVESKLGEGSCFTVVLPFEIDTNARPEEKEDFNADISGAVSYTHLDVYKRQLHRKIKFGRKE